MKLFSLSGRTAVVTGASGAIGKSIALGLIEAGADVALCYHNNRDALNDVIEVARSAGVRAVAYQVNALVDDEVFAHAFQVKSDFGRIDVLFNCVGGNIASAMTNNERRFFDLEPQAFMDTMHLNFLSGTVVPSMAYGHHMVDNESGGSIINVTSMNAFRPLEGRPAYAASKAAVSNFTLWLASHLAKEYSPGLRVNAIAPGFFPNERMRSALFDENDQPTERARRIIDHTPMGRLGNVEDLVGTAIWYASSASQFVTGTVVPVDGGFSAYAGV